MRFRCSMLNHEAKIDDFESRHQNPNPLSWSPMTRPQIQGSVMVIHCHIATVGPRTVPDKFQTLCHPPVASPPRMPQKRKENSKSQAQVVRLNVPYFPLPSMRSVTSACMLRTYSHAKHHAPYQLVYGKPAGRDSRSVSS